MFSNTKKNTPNLLKFIKIYCYSTEILKENISKIFWIVRGRLGVFSKSEQNTPNLQKIIEIYCYGIKIIKENILLIFQMVRDMLGVFLRL